MGLRIATNGAAMIAGRILSNSMREQSKSYQRLSSGERITQASDDAAGLSIAENLRSQIRSMSQAERNANDGISFTQVAEGAMNEIGNILIRLRELGIQAASDTVGDRERGFIHTEAQGLLQEIDRIASVTSFNRVPLLSGEASKDKLEFQVGVENGESSRIAFDVGGLDSRTGTLGIDGLSYETISSSREAFEKVDEAMTKLFRNRASLAAMQNNLQSTVRNIAIAKENLSIARSQIADTDVAAETSELVRSNILHAAGVAVLAQANQVPSQALKLL